MCWKITSQGSSQQQEQYLFQSGTGAISHIVRYRKRKLWFRIALGAISLSVRYRKRNHGLGLHQEQYLFRSGIERGIMVQDCTRSNISFSQVQKAKIMVQDCTRINISFSKVRKKEIKVQNCTNEKFFFSQVQKEDIWFRIALGTISLLVKYRKRNHG